VVSTAIRTLTAGDFDAILAAFNEAFSDYAVRFSLTAAQLREICARRAVVFELSVGAFATIAGCRRSSRP
jgi:hypothetical protein